MSYLTIVFDLFWHFLMLSFLAIGGASSTLPDMHRFLIDTRHYMTSEQLSVIYAVSQAVPGPNVLFVGLFDWQTTSLGGAIAPLIGICGPSCAIAAVVTRVMDRKPDARWITLVHRSLVSLTIGLLFFTGWVPARGADSSFSTIALTVATVLAYFFIRVRPLVLVGFGALVGGMSWVQRSGRPAYKNQGGCMSTSFVGPLASETASWSSGIPQRHS